MSLNCNEINAIIQELDLPFSFIQEVVQPGYDTLALRVIKDGELSNIVICTSPKACRINRTASKITKNSKPLRFNEFLRSNVQGMRINSIEQLGLDRILKLDVSTWQQKYFMYIRLWSGNANVIVTEEDGTILDCMFRRPNKGEVTGGTYIPETNVPTEEERQMSLERFPVRDLQIPEDSFQAKHHDPRYSFNEKIDWFYSEHATSLSRESLLAQAEKWYNSKHSKMESALERLKEKESQFESADFLKHTGDLILAFGHQAQGNAIDCVDYDTNQNVHIRIDPKKSVQENASVYYEQYKKATSGLEALRHDILIAQKALDSLDEEYKAILNEKNVIKLEQLLRKDTTPKQKNEKPHSGLHYEVNGWTILVGRTANENDDLLRHTVRGNDMWLHTRDFAGGYVFIKAQSGKTVPLDIMLYAGNLAVYHSKARKNGQADLYYTQVKYLRRAKNGPKGLVLPTHEKNLLVRIDEEKLRKLDELEKSTEGF